MANKIAQHGGALAAGALGGPVAAGAWEIGYPLVENWLTGGSDSDKANAAQQAGMQTAAGQYQQQGQRAQGARQAATQQQLSAYGGAANAMNLMYGTQYDPRNYAPDLGKNPLMTSAQPTGAPAQGSVFTQQDSARVYERLSDRDKYEGSAAHVLTAPLDMMTGGGPDPKNKDLFAPTPAGGKSGMAAGSKGDQLYAWLNQFKAQNGRFPTNEEKAAWMNQHGGGGDYYTAPTERIV